MSVRLIDARWSDELQSAVRADTASLRIISPFIKRRALARLLGAGPEKVEVITRFSLNDFAQGVSDIDALEDLLKAGAVVRGIRNLHAKLYLFGRRKAVLTSANLTASALDRNHEFGMVADERTVVDACHSYFDRLWPQGRKLGPTLVDDWRERIAAYQATGGAPGPVSGLPDFGADAGFEASEPIELDEPFGDADQAFVKFLGEGDNRVGLSFDTLEEIRRAGCHWTLGYPEKQRPRAVRDGAVMFIARLTHEPNDIRVFGRALGLKHQPGRDDATEADIERRPWMETCPGSSAFMTPSSWPARWPTECR